MDERAAAPGSTCRDGDDRRSSSLASGRVPAAPARPGSSHAGLGSPRRDTLADDAPPRARDRAGGASACGVLDDGVAFARGARERCDRPAGCRAPPGTDERVSSSRGCSPGSRIGGHSRSATRSRSRRISPALLRAGFDEFTGVDLADGGSPGNDDAASADVRELPFENRASTLVSASRRSTRRCRQHGLRLEGRGRRPRARRRCASFGEVARRRGRLLIDRAVRRAVDYGWFRQDDVARLDAALHPGRLLRRGAGGRTSSPRRAGAHRRSSTSTGLRYGERGPAASAVLARSCRPRACAGCSRRAGSSGRRAGGLRARCARYVSTSPDTG